MGFKQTLDNLAPWLDSFAPRKARSEQDRYRLRFVVTVLLAIFIYCLLLSLASFAMPIRPEGRELLTGFCLIFALGIAVGLLVLRMTGSQSFCLQIVIFALLIAMLNISVQLGGIYSPATPVALLVPALATTMLGVRAGIFWAALLVLLLGGFYRADQMGIVFPSVMKPENRSFGTFMGLTSAVATVTLIILFYEITAQKLNARLQKAHDDYLFQANHDSLTGLANRRHFIHIIDGYIDQAGPASERFAILFFDLNRFKEANDLYDHQFGDEVLVQTANRLREQSRNTDYVARWGGDEFAMLLPGISTEERVRTRIDELRSALREPLQIRNTRYCTDASIGHAIYPVHGSTHEALVHHADHEMYGTKRQQRS